MSLFSSFIFFVPPPLCFVCVHLFSHNIYFSFIFLCAYLFSSLIPYSLAAFILVFLFTFFFLYFQLYFFSPPYPSIPYPAPTILFTLSASSPYLSSLPFTRPAPCPSPSLPKHTPVLSFTIITHPFPSHPHHTHTSGFFLYLAFLGGLLPMRCFLYRKINTHSPSLPSLPFGRPAGVYP